MSTDLNEEFFEDFKLSTIEHIKNIHEELSIAADNKRSRIEIVRAKANLQRAVHTIKGESRMMGYANFAVMCENIEKFFRSVEFPMSETEAGKFTAAVNYLQSFIEKPTLIQPKEVDTDVISTEKQVQEHNLIRKMADSEAVVDDTSRKFNRILLLDDSEIVRNLVRSSLEQEGFEVHSVETIPEFIEEFSTFDAQILLIDRNLPDVSPDIEVIDELKKRCDFSGKIVIILSGEDTQVLEEAVKKTGADGFISKNDLQEITSELKKILKSNDRF